MKKIIAYFNVPPFDWSSIVRLQKRISLFQLKLLVEDDCLYYHMLLALAQPLQKTGIIAFLFIIISLPSFYFKAFEWSMNLCWTPIILQPFLIIAIVFLIFFNFHNLFLIFANCSHNENKPRKLLDLFLLHYLLLYQKLLLIGIIVFF